MAILVDFRKSSEGSETVEYQFGFPELNRQLVINKQTREHQPADGHRDRSYTAVAVKILRLYQSEGSWPDQGSYAA